MKLGEKVLERLLAEGVDLTTLSQAEIVAKVIAVALTQIDAVYLVQELRVEGDCSWFVAKTAHFDEAAANADAASREVPDVSPILEYAVRKVSLGAA